jgi:hypothetical protein
MNCLSDFCTDNLYVVDHEPQRLSPVFRDLYRFSSQDLDRLVRQDPFEAPTLVFQRTQAPRFFDFHVSKLTFRSPD